MVFLKDVIYKPITGEWGIEGDKVSVLRTTNFTNAGVLDLSKVIKRDISDKKITQKKLIKGDIIIEKSGGSPNQPVGRVVFFEENGVYLCNNFTSILRPRKDIVEPKYLHYLLFAGHKFRVTESFQNKTTGIINLQLSRYIEKIKIPLPPLIIQKRIAEILDNATALRDKTKLLLEDYDKLAQSIFLEIFGDPVHNPKNYNQVKINYFVKKLESGKSVNSNDSKYENGAIGILKTSSVYDGVFNPIEAKVIREEEIKLAKLNPRKDSIIISRMNTEELVGKSAYIFKDFKNLFLPDRLWQTVKSQNPHSVLWLSHAIKQPSFMRNISKVATGTSGSMKNISQKKFLGIQVINPPLDLQNEFTEKITLIEQQKDLAKQELKESEDLFNTLLQKAFKGELVKEEGFEMKLN